MNYHHTSQKYYNLGSFHRSVTTISDTAQTWFDRGLIWTYGFNHEEAARCFEEAIHDDPNCPMAYWGLAFTLGPNYNKPWHVFDEKERLRAVDRTRQAALDAKGAASHATPIEKALIDALQFRYPLDSPISDCPSWNLRYAEAMECVYREFSEDLDVVTLYADSLMELTPWELWDIDTGKPAAVFVQHQALQRHHALDCGRCYSGSPSEPWYSEPKSVYRRHHHITGRNAIRTGGTDGQAMADS